MDFSSFQCMLHIPSIIILLSREWKLWSSSVCNSLFILFHCFSSYGCRCPRGFVRNTLSLHIFYSKIFSFTPIRKQSGCKIFRINLTHRSHAIGIDSLCRRLQFVWSC
jgi:hypothetical protein